MQLINRMLQRETSPNLDYATDEVKVLTSETSANPRPMDDFRARARLAAEIPTTSASDSRSSASKVY